MKSNSWRQMKTFVGDNKPVTLLSASSLKIFNFSSNLRDWFSSEWVSRPAETSFSLRVKQKPEEERVCVITSCKLSWIVPSCFNPRTQSKRQKVKMKPHNCVKMQNVPQSGCDPNQWNLKLWLDSTWFHIKDVGQFLCLLPMWCPDVLTASEELEEAEGEMLAV